MVFAVIEGLFVYLLVDSVVYIRRSFSLTFFGYFISVLTIDSVAYKQFPVSRTTPPSDLKRSTAIS